MEKPKYIILTEDTALELMKEVNFAMEEGYIPQGGITREYNYGKWLCAQAMILAGPKKRGENEDN